MFKALLFYLGLIAAMLAGAGAQAQDGAPERYTLGSGDKIYITVFGQDDLSGEFVVNGSGQVSLPLIGDIAVARLSLAEAEAAVIGKLKPEYLRNPRVSIQVLNYRPFYILGEVKQPGSYPYVSGMSVVQAVALAGGYTYRARENRLLIVRGTDEKRREQPADHDTSVLPGDIIRVPERFF